MYRGHGSKNVFRAMNNNMVPGRMRIIRDGISKELSGRLTPYIVERAMGEVEHKWEYCNITRSRFIFIWTGESSQTVLGVTRESMGIMSEFKPPNCSFVRNDNLGSYSVNVST